MLSIHCHLTIFLMPDFIITNLGKENPNDLHTSGTNIVTEMTANVDDFPAPPVKLTDVTAKLNQLKPFLKEKDALSTNDRKSRDAIIADIVKMLQRNGRYVIMLFPEDELKQILSGYLSAKARKRMTGPPDAPYNVRVRRGLLSGQLIANCRKHRGTESLNIKVYNDKTRESFIFSSPSGVGIKIDGLVPADTYTISIQAVGSKGTSNFVSTDSIICG